MCIIIFLKNDSIIVVQNVYSPKIFIKFSKQKLSLLLLVENYISALTINFSFVFLNVPMALDGSLKRSNNVD
jgi:hypothetical protein